MKLTAKASVFLLVISIIFSAFALNASAESKNSVNTKEITAISDMGEHSVYPENSEKAIEEAIKQNADMIRIPLKKTADGKFILSEDNDLSRMCNTDKTPVNELDYNTVKTLKLRGSSGGNTSETEETVSELCDILNKFKDKTVFLLDINWEERDSVYNAVQNTGALNKCIFACRTNAKQALSWKSEKNTDIKIMVYLKTNIIFKALSAAKAVKYDSNAFLWLATTNQHGVIFNKTVTNTFKDISGVCFCLTNTETNSKRPDTINFWDDLVSRNYNMIITDNLSELTKYRNFSKESRQKLSDYFNKVNNEWQLPNLKGKVFSEYKFEYNNAYSEAERLCSKSFAGAAECDNALYGLKSSIDRINENYESLSRSDSGLKITPARIITAIIAVPAFIAVEYFFHKHRGKKVKNK